MASPTFDRFWGNNYFSSTLIFVFYSRMSRNMCKMRKLRNGQNLSPLSPNFTNLFFLSLFYKSFIILFVCFEVYKLILFLFVRKLALQMYAYSYLREGQLFAEH